MTKEQIRADVGLGTWENIDCSLADFKARLDKAAESIGADETTACFFFETDSDYDGGYTLNAHVYRWETDGEYAARRAEEERRSVAYEEARRVEQQRRERLLYEELKAKYGA